MNWVTTSSRLYAVLLRFYPKRFREAYGDELQLVFRDCARDGYQRGGGWEVLRVWSGVLPDLIVSAAEQHAEEESTVSLKVLIGILSGAGVIGGGLWILASVLILQRPEGSGGAYRDVTDLMPLFFVGLQLFSMGLIAVFLLPGRHWEPLARVLLLVAAGGGLLTAGVWQLYADSADWITLISGFMIQTACLALAGLGLLRRGDSRAWGLLLLALAVIRLLVNLDDWRAVFLAVAGAMCVGLMVLMFRKSPGPNPGTPALS